MWKFVPYIIISNTKLLIVALNKLRSYYSRTSALGPEGQCASCFQRMMCISCRRHMWTPIRDGGGSGGDLAPSLGGTENFFADLNDGFPEIMSIFTTKISDDLFYGFFTVLNAVYDPFFTKKPLFQKRIP